MSAVQSPRDVPAHLTPDALAQMREQMLTQVARLEARDAALRAQLSSEESETPNTFVAGVEGAMISSSDEQAIALLHHEQAELAALRSALARMDSGHYGWCSACGEAISPARLQAMPEVGLCLDCQDAREHARST